MITINEQKLKNMCNGDIFIIGKNCLTNCLVIWSSEFCHKDHGMTYENGIQLFAFMICNIKQRMFTYNDFLIFVF